MYKRYKLQIRDIYMFVRTKKKVSDTRGSYICVLTQKYLIITKVFAVCKYSLPKNHRAQVQNHTVFEPKALNIDGVFQSNLSMPV